MPTFTDSRLGPGTLTLGATDFSVQISNARLAPDVQSDDGTPTLAEPKPAPLMEVSWSLEGEAISDWSAADGFVMYCLANSGSEVAFVFTPDTAAGTNFSGTCQIRPVEIGGNVAEQVTVPFAFPLKGDPSHVAGGGTKAASTSTK